MAGSDVFRGSSAPAEVCTIAARNYLPFVRVLADSVQKHGDRLSVFFTDDPDGMGGGELSYCVLTSDDLGIDRSEYLRMAAMYDVTELATAVKPWVLSALRRRGAEAAIYLDPDIAVFAPLADLSDLARRHGIVLTPHAPNGLPRDDKFPEERSILAAGIYNLGFLAVGASGDRFLEWWRERLRRHCVNDVTNMHFVDQRWVDFVPGMFEHLILRDPGCNAAYWNLHGRTVELDPSRGYRIDGASLRFFHFSGYSPDSPHLLSKHQLGQPRVLLSEHPAVRMLCDWYRGQLLAHGWDGRSQSYGWGRLGDGTALDPRMRRLYRAALLESEAAGTDEPPSPFVDGGADFLTWLRAPVHPPLRPVVSRYLTDVWRTTPGFRAASNVLVREGAVRYIEWLRAHGHSTDIPASMLPDATAGQRALAPLAPLPGRGVVVLQQARRPALPQRSWELCVPPGQRCQVVGLSPSLSGCDVRPDYRTSDVTILAVSPLETFHLALEDDLDLFATRHLVGLWSWATESFPTELANCFAPVDEVWVPSTFSRRAVETRSPRPVKVYRPLVQPRGSASDHPAPGRRAVLAPIELTGDADACAMSGAEDAVRAFREAFAEEDGPVLALALSGDVDVLALEALREVAGGRTDVTITAVDQDMLLRLAGAADATISLHRSSAFSLPVATAMASGRPVIATAYGGVVDYATDANSFLVPFRFGPHPTRPDVRWALPHLPSAVRWLRTVLATDNPEAAVRAAQAQQDMAERYSVRAVSAELEMLLSDLRRAPRRRDIAWFEALLAPAPRALPTS